MVGRSAEWETAGQDGAAVLDCRAPAPLYRQLLLDLERRIAAGAFDPHSLLPSEAQIERAYGVSRITVRRALQELERQGLIERRQGRATRLVRHSGRGSPDREAHLAEILSLGFRTDSQVLELEILPAAPEIAERLQLEPGEPVQRTLRLRRLGGAPVCRSLAYVPSRYAERVSRGDLERESLLLLLVRDGLIVSRVEQSIGAVPACRDLARCLEVEDRSPLLLIERLFRDEGDRPVELVYSHFRADRYRYGMSLSTDPDLTGRTGTAVLSRSS